MHCKPEQIQSYLDQALEPQSQHQMEKHIQNCPKCRSLLAELQEVDLLFAQEELPAQPPSLPDTMAAWVRLTEQIPELQSPKATTGTSLPQMEADNTFLSTGLKQENNVSQGLWKQFTAWWYGPIIAMATTLLFLIQSPEQTMHQVQLSKSTASGSNTPKPQLKTQPAKRGTEQVHLKPVPKRSHKRPLPKKQSHGPPAKKTPKFTPKGKWPSFTMYYHCKKGSQNHKCPTLSGHVLAPGTAIQFHYQAPSKTELMFVSVNQEGVISKFIPLHNNRSAGTEIGEGYLPAKASLILDDYIGKEHILMISARKPFTYQQVKAELQKTYLRPKGVFKTGLHNQQGWYIDVITIQKRHLSPLWRPKP